MSKFRQGTYVPKNPEKYVGKGTIRYRSGWELTFCMFLDNNEHVVSWASEAISIPYRNPITGKQSMYVPDFFIQYRTRDGKVMSEIVEIKPKKQSLVESKMSNQARAVVAVNYAKWDMATKWCKRNGLTFRVITEDDIFHQGNKRK